jgi:hypothetical protein
MTDDEEITAPEAPASPPRPVRQRTAKGKLIGWGALAAIIVVIIAIFAITRVLTPSAPGPVTTASASASSAAASSAASQPAATASSEAAPPASSASVASAAPASATPASSASDGQTLAVIQPDIMDQASRKALLGTLIDQGVFTGIEAVGSPPKVGVTALFLGLNPDLQRQFLATVDSYVNNGAPAQVPLQVIDATTAKTIGTYTSADGLKLL